ncbi:MAG: hypothetical protein QGD93_10450, partial [Actinomycetota bacterium]|nr:hypothetical protein [Actinomycetota bacterium]
MAISNADLAQKISTLIDFWSTLTVEYKNWLGGTVAGGPNSDGQYPLTNFTGDEILVESPAKLSDNVGGFVDQAETAETNAAASAVAALASEDEATVQEGLADTARIAAESARTTAQNEATAALNSSVNATASQAAALVSEDAALVSELAAAVSAAAALVSELAAADSATEAATFDPINFYLRTALDGGQLDNRYYTETEIDAGYEPIDVDIAREDQRVDFIEDFRLRGDAG